ncbi:hypothetical protein ACIPJ2_15140 [Curtobacterium sp. NPDC090217]
MLELIRQHYDDIAWLLAGAFASTALGWLYSRFGRRRRGRHD